MIRYTLKKFADLSIHELYDIMALRQMIFVVEQDCPYLDADGLDPNAFHLMGRDQKGRLMTYTRILPPGVYYPQYVAIGRATTHISIRRKGEGKKLIRISIDCCRWLFPEYNIQLSAQAYLIDFYRSLGFRSVGQEYLEDGIPHIRMIRQHANENGAQQDP